MPATVLARNTKPPTAVHERATTKKSTIGWAVLALLTTLAAFAAGRSQVFEELQAWQMPDGGIEAIINHTMPTASINEGRRI
eukprot:5224273-Pleurochrysis_carterae.AAC.1